MRKRRDALNATAIGRWRGWVGVGVLALAGCGGGGGDDPPAPEMVGPSAATANLCNPGNRFASGYPQTGSLAIEKQWVRSYVNEAYLWHDEVRRVDPALPEFNTPDPYESIDNYFDALRVASKDRFSFTRPTAEWNALSQAGVGTGNGIEFVSDSDRPPRNIRIAYVEPGSDAAVAGLRRGDVLLSVNGVSADDDTTMGVSILNAASFPQPTAVGISYSWSFARSGAALPTLSLVVSAVTKQPVPVSTVITTGNGSRVGYLVFNDHLATAEQPLIDAVSAFAAQGISDLVLDLRYNGGGYLSIASQLAYMIGGTRTSGKVFERLVFSAKRNASSGTTYPFLSTTLSGSRALPSLNLGRVYVLAQSGTCSASESIINSLRGIDVDVRLIGGTTCGKPYGFSARDNCGVSYFPIEFRGTNAKGFGDYATGFVPAGAGATGVAGCQVSDDTDHALGDSAELMLRTALAYRNSGNLSCAIATGRPGPLAAARPAAPKVNLMWRGPLRENRIVQFLP